MWCGGDQSNSCNNNNNDYNRPRLKSDGDCVGFGEDYVIGIIGTPGVGKTAICQTYIAGREMHAWDKMSSNKHSTVRKTEFCTWDEVDGQDCCVRLSQLEIPFEASRQCRTDYDNRHSTTTNSNDTTTTTTTTSTIPCIPLPHDQFELVDGFLLVYSVTDRNSFDAIPGLYHCVMGCRNHNDTPLVLTGNKYDLTPCRHISVSEGRDAAFDLGASFYETSVTVCPEEVKYLFHDVIRQVRAVRMHTRSQEQTCNRVRGLINRLSLRSRKRRSRSRSRLRLMTSSQQTL